MVKRALGSLIFSCLYMVLCAQQAQIKGSLTDISSKPYVVLFQYYIDQYRPIDTIKHKSGKFLYKPKTALPRGFYKIGESTELSIPLIFGNEKIEITGSVKDGGSSTVILNSKENEAFKFYATHFETFSKQVGKLYEKVQVLNSGAANLSQNDYQKELDKIRITYDSLNTIQNGFYKSFSAKYPGTFMKKLSDMMFISDTTNARNFLQMSEFTDNELLYSDFLSSKVSFFFQRFVSPREEDFQKGAEQILNMVPKNTDARIISYMAIGDVFAQNQLQSAEALYGMFRTEFPENPKVKDYLRRKGVIMLTEGELAPEISLPDTSGKEVRLSALKGKVVLLDFWASWCGPCRMENPNVVRAYQKYKDKGFEIFSVSLDNTKYKWLQAIQNDRLTWYHVSDLKGWQSQGAAIYNVRSIPATFLLDREGKIIAKNLRGRALDEALEKILTK